MKRVQWKSIKSYGLLILMHIAFIVFVFSCQEETLTRPSAKFIIKGKVLAVENNLPLKDVVVKMLEDTTGMDSMVIANITLLKDSVVTDQNGNFEVEDTLGMPTNKSYILKFIDSEKKFQATNKIKFTNPGFTKGDGYWYSGETTKVQTFKLKTRKEKRPTIIYN